MSELVGFDARAGSLDAAIVEGSMEPNDFGAMFAFPGISRVRAVLDVG